MRRDCRKVRSIRVATLIALLAGLFAFVATPSSADVTAVQGSASGYETRDFSLFRGPQTPVPPTPTVTLASDASNSPQTATAPTGIISYGPAFLFTSDTIEVSTSGTLGAGGSVESRASIQNINRAASQPATGSEVFSADSLVSTCRADESGAPTGSTTVTNGELRVDAQPVDHDEVVEPVLASPPPNTVMAGHLHIPPNEDKFVFVFNEQTQNPDGSITVTALHQYLGFIVNEQGQIVEDPVAYEQNGSVARGHILLGQVTCGVTATQTGTSTTLPDGNTTTTQPGGSTTTTQPGGSTTTTQPGASTTTTRPGGTTTTTRPSATTTTIRTTTTTSTVAPVSGGGGGGGTPSSDSKSVLVRTGSAFQRLGVFALLTLVLGALVLIGFGGRVVGAGAGSGTAPWVAAVRQAMVRRRRRRPWNRRPWV
ncbi:MAG TPA: hypothetical protein VHH09_06990 [Acidimicrobiales bacterium]|nr:hypothetical protein [Acidimicrobiales bacterium]